MKTPQLDMHLRNYCNSPGIDDGDELRAWIAEFAKIWNRKQRDHNCKELGKLSNDEVDDNDDINMSCISKFVKVSKDVHLSIKVVYVGIVYPIGNVLVIVPYKGHRLE